jgi:hypothetical protein
MFHTPHEISQVLVLPQELVQMLGL